MNRLAVILLAAGESKRMGQPKQLLPFRGQPLIAHTLNQLTAMDNAGIFVVLGAHYEAVLAACHPFSVQTCYNPNFSHGMGSSIATGMYALFAHSPGITHILIALVDQPMLTTAHYQQLIERSTHFPDKVIAAHYQGIPGAPMLFPAAFFPKLLSLSGDQGARKIIRSQPEYVISITMPEAAHDWDRPEDMYH